MHTIQFPNMLMGIPASAPTEYSKHQHKISKESVATKADTNLVKLFSNVFILLSHVSKKAGDLSFHQIFVTKSTVYSILNRNDYLDQNESFILQYYPLILRSHMKEKHSDRTPNPSLHVLIRKRNKNATLSLHPHVHKS